MAFSSTGTFGGSVSDIRAAEVIDLPKLHECAREFYAASKFLCHFDVAKFTALWSAVIESGRGVIFLLEQDGSVIGTIGGMAYEDIYSAALVATEFFWFVRPEHRGAGIKLYHQFEAWARERGCSAIRMVHLVDVMPEKVERFYTRLGFEPVEIHYSKELSQ